MGGQLVYLWPVPGRLSSEFLPKAEEKRSSDMTNYSWRSEIERLLVMAEFKESEENNVLDIPYTGV